MTALKNLLAAIFLVLLICATNVEAKFVTDKVPLLTFAETAVPVYDAPNGTKKGTIPPENSLVLVKQILADGWAYGSYKPSNSQKRVYRWFKMKELQGGENFENYIDQLSNDTNVLRTRTAYNFIGNAPSNEDVLVVVKLGDKSKIIFKAEEIYYRMGWVENSSLKKNSGSDYDYPEDTGEENIPSDSIETPAIDNEESSGTIPLF